MSTQTRNLLLSWLRVFVAAMLTAVLAALVDGGLSAINWTTVLIAGLVSVLPVVINWLNPNDPRYGRVDAGA